MPCIEPAAAGHRRNAIATTGATGAMIAPSIAGDGRTRRGLLVLSALAAGSSLVLVGCGSAPSRPGAAPAPAQGPAPSAPTAPTAPSTAAPAAPRPAAPSAAGRIELPEPSAARTWDDFRRQAARRLVAAHPDGSYMGKPPEILFGIPVIETELYVDGTIKSINVMRVPADERARDTVKLAMDAIRRAAPYGDMSRLPRPWKWVEVFLFNDRRQFKPRTLDN